MTDIITAENLVKHYGNLQALKGISFSIRAGECFGFLGHNGAGKSTTMRMLYGLSTVEQGVLRIFGQTAHLTPPSLKKLMGIVPQEDNLDFELSVLANLEVYGGLFGLSRREANMRAQKLLQFLGLEDKANANVESLSGGLKRRLVIARALINDPRLVILDEPTTGLDPQSRHLVWQKLRDLKNQGVTLVLTTHYMEEATQLCDRLVIMHEGAILAEGSPGELIARHILPYVIELHVPIDKLPVGLIEKAANLGAVPLQIVDRLYLYTAGGEELWHKLHAWGLPASSCLLRATGLEDVFLKLTGRGEDD